MAAKLISVNVSAPRETLFKGKTITTGIFKQPVKGRLKLQRLNLDGDRQADLKVHGGVDKAVYAYPFEHYDYWKKELPEIDFAPGMFGENFTTHGLLEDHVFIGDSFQIGSAEVMVTQPRMPCYKLAAKFGRDDIVKRFLLSRRSGFYLSVVEEGEVGAGDEIFPIEQQENSITVKEVVEIYLHPELDRELLLRAIQVEALPESWRNYFVQELDSPKNE